MVEKLEKKVIRALMCQSEAHRLRDQLSVAAWDSYVRHNHLSKKNQVRVIRRNISLLVDFYGMKRKRLVNGCLYYSCLDAPLLVCICNT